MNKDQLRIVFFGTPEFAVTSLHKIVSEGYNVVGAVTMPDKPAGRGKHLCQSPVKEYAIARNIPLLQPERLKDETFLEALKTWHADLFVVIAFRMLPEVVWQMPPLGTFNLHASLLPLYRGAAPINWAVINGDTHTGVTTFFLKHEIDTGDIIQQETVEILPTDNAGSVHDKLMELGANLTVDTIRHIMAGDLKTIPQEQLLTGARPTPAPKIFKETCHIDWNQPAEKIHNLIRGLSPYPAAWSNLSCEGRDLGAVKIFSSKVIDKHPNASIAGSVLTEHNKIVVNCAEGALELLEIQAPGKKRMATADFLRGARLDGCCLFN